MLNFIIHTKSWGLAPDWYILPGSTSRTTVKFLHDLVRLSNLHRLEGSHVKAFLFVDTDGDMQI